MTPTATGRHCASCQETVVDFTRMSEAEVVAFLQQHPGVSCGRFRGSQLDRPLLAPARAVGGWRRWWGATLALLGLGALAAPKAQGQAAPAAYWGGPVPQNQVQPTKVGTTAAGLAAGRVDSVGGDNARLRDGSLLTINGVVYDAHGRPREGIEVGLSSALPDDFVTTTDAQGRFQLVVPIEGLGEEPAVTAYHWERVGWHYQLASADIDKTSQKSYVLHLKNRMKRRSHSVGKFR
ncbi:hypothetical protein Q4S41_01590 [Hymenobacter sp. CA1UV-4]|nr:hypothetical protein [Hymenobacter sp. CA1UV-4]